MCGAGSCWSALLPPMPVGPAGPWVRACGGSRKGGIWLDWIPAAARGAAGWCANAPSVLLTLAPTHPPAAPAATYGGTNIFFHHGGSPLRLLGLLLASCHALWGALYLLHHRVAASACYAALLLAALLPLLNAQSICHRLLLAPGVLTPLGDLHAVLGALQ